MKLLIKVPPRKSAHHKGHKARYVSPATASLSYTIDGGSPVTVAISTSNPDCIVAGAISYLQCDVQFAIAPGSHAFSFSTYDAQSRLLSANTGVTYVVQAGASNQIPVTLGGVATSIAFVFPPVAQLTGSQFGGMTLAGPNPISVSVLPADADGAYIIGPGAPQPTLSVSGATVGTPAPSAPNLWTVSNTTPEVLPTASTTSSFSASATPVPNSGGSTVSANVGLSLMQPWVYVASEQPDGGAIASYDLLGNNTGIPLSGPSDPYFPGVAAPSGIAYNPVSQVFTVSNASGPITQYLFEGSPLTVTGFAGASNAVGIAYSPGAALFAVALPSAIKIYSGNGSPAATTFALPGTPTAIAFDVNLFVYVSCGTAGVAVYALNGFEVSQPGSYAGLQNAQGLVYDPNNGYLYVVDAGSKTVRAFDENGSSIALQGSFSGLQGPAGIAYDATQDRLYVTDATASTVLAFDTQGRPEPLTAFAGISQPSAVLAIP
jgi:DNA-binding beta-propeller fold protein YncE